MKPPPAAGNPPIAAAPHPDARRRTLRTIATFEAVKGVVALAAAFGLLGLLHHDLHAIALALIGHIGLDPDAHYPSLLLHYADLLHDANLRKLYTLIAAYIAVRAFESWGLWHERAWGEWLGALSGAIYLPLEFEHFLHRPRLANAAVVAFNLAVVVFLGWQLWRRRRGGA
ncbi:MAG: DUF2127 domain-containing protein [Burkholderiales bacterium]|nr:DUF2127 domain-containing protein [Burkholderiales bacterium]